MPAQGPTTAQRVQERLAELLANGWTVPLLAKALGVAQNTIYVWLKDGPNEKRVPLLLMALGHRMFRKPPSRTSPYRVRGLQDRLDALIERGWTMQVISEILGTYRPSVSRWRQGGAGSRDRITALALDNPVFDRKPPKRKRYNPKP